MQECMQKLSVKVFLTLKIRFSTPINKFHWENVKGLFTDFS